MNGIATIVFFPPNAPLSAQCHSVEISDTLLPVHYAQLVKDDACVYIAPVSDTHFVTLHRQDGFFVMTGYRGRHILNAEAWATDFERLAIHWAGFCFNNRDELAYAASPQGRFEAVWNGEDGRIKVRT